MKRYNQIRIGDTVHIITDDEIKDGDLVIETSNGNKLEIFADYSLNQKSMGCKKVVHSFNLSNIN